MMNKDEATMDGSGSLHADRKTVTGAIRLWLGYAGLVIMCFSVSLLALVMRAALPVEISQRWGRQFVSATFRAYLRFLAIIGACRFDLTELDGLRDSPPVIVAPNHPCLLDAILVLSRLPGAGCIMKAELVNNIFFGAGARLLGYTRNTPLRSMVQLAIADLHAGNHLLLFPEGTRTTRFPVGRMQGTTGLISKYANVPVQTVFIETNSGFLGKSWSIFRVPAMPVTYRVRIGKRFSPPEDTAAFTRELEQYFQTELAHAQLPAFGGAESLPLNGLAGAGKIRE